MMRSVFIISLLLMMIISCRRDKYEPEITDGSYPAAVEEIIVAKCAQAGCHNTQSQSASAGLDLSSWNKMFGGSSTGAVTIPFSTDFSPLLYFTNTDSMEGIVASPTMPYNAPKLSKADYYILRDWIAKGAPDSKGFVKFSDNPFRKKIYISNQGCDIVAVMDAETKVVMRYVNTGVLPGAAPPEAPHQIKITPDGLHWIAVFNGGAVMQVFSTLNDQLEHTVSIPQGGWNTFDISPDSKRAYACDYSDGKLITVDIENGILLDSFTLSKGLHGTALNAAGDTLYIGKNNNSSFLFKVPVNNMSNYTLVNLNVPPTYPYCNPHSIVFSPDNTKYFITCEAPNVNQVRVADKSNDAVIGVIHVGIKPVEMAVSEKAGLLFVTCMEDNYFPGITGSVSVIDINTLQEIKRIRVGWQPHGIVVDDEEGLVYVSNRNYGAGSPPHHPSVCAGNNGNLSVIDIASLQTINSIHAELSVDPYGMAIRK
jgi:YVTN family beta-propeller protein